MFNHNINEQDKNDLDVRRRMASKMDSIKERNRRYSNHQSKNVCETAYFNGLDSCSNENCPDEHDLDYNRIRRGICHFYVLNRCRKKGNCLFCHEIPESVKNNPNTVSSAEAFVKGKRHSSKSVSFQASQNGIQHQPHPQQQTHHQQQLSQIPENREPIESRQLGLGERQSAHELWYETTTAQGGQENYHHNDSISNDENPASNIQNKPINSTYQRSYHETQIDNQAQPVEMTNFIPHHLQPQNYDHFLFLMKHFIQNQSHLMPSRHLHPQQQHQQQVHQV